VDEVTGLLYKGVRGLVIGCGLRPPGSVWKGMGVFLEGLLQVRG